MVYFLKSMLANTLGETSEISMYIKIHYIERNFHPINNFLALKCTHDVHSGTHCILNICKQYVQETGHILSTQ